MTKHTHDCMDREDQVCIDRGYCICACGATRTVLSAEEPLEEKDFEAWIIESQGTEGQDRESYSDTQDRDSYTTGD